MVDNEQLVESIASRLATILRPLRLLRVKDAAAKIAVCRTQFYEVCKRSDFPTRVRSEATGVSGWWEHEIDEWMRENYQR